MTTAEFALCLNSNFRLLDVDEAAAFGDSACFSQLGYGSLYGVLPACFRCLSRDVLRARRGPYGSWAGAFRCRSRDADRSVSFWAL